MRIRAVWAGVVAVVLVFALTAFAVANDGKSKGVRTRTATHVGQAPQTKVVSVRWGCPKVEPKWSSMADMSGIVEDGVESTRVCWYRGYVGRRRAVLLSSRTIAGSPITEALRMPETNPICGDSAGATLYVELKHAEYVQGVLAMLGGCGGVQFESGQTELSSTAISQIQNSFQKWFR